MTDYYRYGLAAALAGVTFYSAAAFGAPPSYTLTPLGVGTSTTPLCGASDIFTPDAGGINDANEVTGLYCRHGQQENVRGFRWRRGKIEDLGVPAGFPDDPTTVVQPSGINARGHVVGQVSQNGSRPSAFLWDGSRMTVIVDQAIATAINNPGQVAGVLLKPTSNGAFLYSHGQVKDLGLLPGAINTEAGPINNRGHIAGEADIPTGTSPPFYSPLVLWTGARWKNLGTLAGDIGPDLAASTPLTRLLGPRVTPRTISTPSSGTGHLPLSLACRPPSRGCRWYFASPGSSTTPGRL